MQERQVLRYDPLWSLEITDGASCFLQLLRLGVPKDPTLKMKREEACVVWPGGRKRKARDANRPRPKSFGHFAPFVERPLLEFLFSPLFAERSFM